MAVIADSDKIEISGSQYDPGKRGFSVYSATELFNVTGRDQGGQRVTGRYEQSKFYLTVEERIDIARKCSPVAGIVNSRMNRIAGLIWRVVPEKTYMDQTYDRLKKYKQVYDEFEGQADVKYIVARARIYHDMVETLPELLPDMSNFQRCLLRWKRNIERVSMAQARNVELWIETPNKNDNWGDFIKSYVFDLMIHGAAVVYKETKEDKVDNIYMLPGGSVYPLKGEYVDSPMSYAQVIYGKEPLIYFKDEISFHNYLPTSARAWGNIPLESLINKIVESLLFDKLMADQADGTQLPNKMVVMGENNPFGNLREEFTPTDPDEQHAIETKLNQPRKGGVVTFTGNTATVVDLSRENTMQIQMQRQKDIREEVGLAFNGSNMEMNLTGSSNTSGRETSETQQEISEGRGIIPITKIIADMYNREIIPFRFGNGFIFEFDTGTSEIADMDLILKKVQTGIYAVNEIRVDDMGLDPVDDKKYDIPMAPAPQEDQPEGMF